MSKLILILGLLTFSLSANAQADSQNPYLLPFELCNLETEENSVDLEVTNTLDIADAQSLSPTLLKYVNQYLQGQQYTTKDLSLEEAKALMAEDGEYPSDDLVIIDFKSKSTGRAYIQVKSWPGDNPYGYIYNAKTGKLVATNGDDSISLITLSGGQVSCFELGK